MSLKYLSCPSKILSASISSSATSFKLNNIEGWDGVNLTSADFGTQAFAVIRNANNTILELIEFDPATIASASITITRRGLKFTGDLTTEVAVNKLSWTKGDTFIDIGVDTPQMHQWLKEYFDAAIVAGGVPATTAILGLSKMSVAPASAASPIAVGDNDPRVPTADENDALAGVGTPSATNKFVTQTGLTTIDSFGSGDDGTVNMDGTNTYASFASKSGNIYTLTRDMQAENLTIGAGVTLNTDGFVIYVRDTITGTGTIRHSDPATGVGGTGGSGTKAGGGSGAGGGIVVIMAAVWSGTFTIESIGSAGGAGGSAGAGSGSGGTAGTQRGTGVFIGPAGKAGADGVSSGTNSGTAGTAGGSVSTISLAINAGATGGKGGGTNSDGVGNQAGGAGGSYTIPTVGITLYKFLATSLFGLDSTGLLKKLSTLPGSGSGASGGWDASPSETAGGGGGGGGNGGYCVFIYKSKTWTGSSTFTGGAGGAAGSGGTNTAPAAGSNGATGSLIQLNWLELI